MDTLSRADRGFSLLEVILFSSVVGVAITFSGTMISAMIRDQKTQEFKNHLMLLRDNFSDLIKDPVSWRRTVANNPAVGGAWAQFTPFTSDGQPYLNYAPTNPAQATSGFNYSGDVCNGFNAATGNASCPARMTFQWRQRPNSCNGVPGPCVPEVEYRIRVAINGGQASTFKTVNPAQFDLDDVRPGETVTITSSNCPAGRAVAGFDNNGAAICRTAASINLAANPPPPPAPAPRPGPAPGPGPARTCPAPYNMTPAQCTAWAARTGENGYWYGCGMIINGSCCPVCERGGGGGGGAA